MKGNTVFLFFSSVLFLFRHFKSFIDEIFIVLFHEKTLDFNVVFMSCLCGDDAPGGGVELEGEDDVVGVTRLTDEAALRAQVAVEHVVGGVLQQCEQVVCILTLCDLEENIRMLQGGRRQVQRDNE